MSCKKCGPSRVMTTICPTCGGHLDFGNVMDRNDVAHPVQVPEFMHEQIMQKPQQPQKLQVQHPQQQHVQKKK